MKCRDREGEWKIIWSIFLHTLVSRKARDGKKRTRTAAPCLSVGGDRVDGVAEEGSPYAEEDVGRVRTRSMVANLIMEVKDGR